MKPRNFTQITSMYTIVVERKIFRNNGNCFFYGTLFALVLFVALAPNLFSQQRSERFNGYVRMTLPNQAIAKNLNQDTYYLKGTLTVGKYLELVDKKAYNWLEYSDEKGEHYLVTGLFVRVPMSNDQLEYLKQNPDLHSKRLTVDRNKNYYVAGEKLYTMIEQRRQQKMIERLPKPFLKADR